MKLIGSLIMLSALSFADTFQGGTLTTSTTPTQFSSTLGYVQRITIHMVPGACEKVYIGGSAMSTSTLYNTFKIMYPNCSGGLSDSWTLQDNSGANGINASAIYFAGGLGGYPVTWETVTSSSTPSKFLTLTQSGPCTVGTPLFCAVQTSEGGTAVDVIQIAVVPGMSGKIDLYSSALFGYLYPNNGTVTGNITDKWELYAVNTNGISAVTIYPSAEVSGEYAVIGVWQRQ